MPTPQHRVSLMLSDHAHHHPEDGESLATLAKLAKEKDGKDKENAPENEKGPEKEEVADHVLHQSTHRNL
jgi:hypothetical protein